MIKKQTILKWLIASLWVTIGASIIVLLVAAIRKDDSKKCTGINVVIRGVSNNFFVDKKDILKAINEYIDGSPIGQPVRLLNLRALENDLQKNVWVKQAQLFFDNNAMLQIIVVEREPVARVFTTTGNTFYLDSSLAMLPLSEKYSARLPVFTGFPSDKAVLQKRDSILLKDIFTISMALQNDPFWMAMIEQVDITAYRSFEMVSKIGDATIVFGDASNTKEKLNKLLLFYRQVLVKNGWDKYSLVNVQYANQVVAKRKGAEDKSADSLRTLQLMQLMAITAEQQADDSLHNFLQDNENNTTDISLILQSIQRDDNGEVSIIADASSPKAIPVTVTPVLEKPIVKINITNSINNRNEVKINQPSKENIDKEVGAKSKVNLSKPPDIKPIVVKSTIGNVKPVVKKGLVTPLKSNPVIIKPIVNKPIVKKPIAKQENDY